MNESAQAFYAARDFLLAHREDYDDGLPRLRVAASSTEFNWALDWFDASPRPAATAPALWIVEQDGSEQQLDVRRAGARGPTRSPTGCARRGCARGDRIVLMLGNQVELWETMLAAMKLGAVVIPATHAARPRPTCATGSTAATRKHVVVGGGGRRPSSTASQGDYTRIAVGDAASTGWRDYDDA